MPAISLRKKRGTGCPFSTAALTCILIVHRLLLKKEAAGRRQSREPVCVQLGTNIEHITPVTQGRKKDRKAFVLREMSPMKTTSNKGSIVFLLHYTTTCTILLHNMILCAHANPINHNIAWSIYSLLHSHTEDTVYTVQFYTIIQTSHVWKRTKM